MASHAPVILVAGNHGRELEGDLYVYARARGKHDIYLCTEPEFIELGRTAVAVFPYPRKAGMVGDEQALQEAFARQIEEFNQRFARRPGCYKLFFGHFGVAGARVSSGQPLVGRCVEYPLEPLRGLCAQLHRLESYPPATTACAARVVPRLAVALRLQRSRRQRLPPGDAAYAGDPSRPLRHAD